MRKVYTVLIALFILCPPAWASDKTSDKAKEKDKKQHVKVTTSASGFDPNVVGPAAPKLSTVTAPLTLEPPKSADPVTPSIKPPESKVKDPIEQTNLLVKAVRSKEWGVAIGLALMLIIWAIGWFWPALPGAWLPSLAISLGILSTVGVELSYGGVWWKAILSGLTTGVAATGCWEALGKQLLGSRKNALVKRAAKKA